jgi:tRNA(His) 5'-end guanylyltransferase
MKELEKAYRTYLPKNSYAVIRVDGKGFSKYTKNLEKPFDYGFTADMRETAKYLCENVDGALFAYTQSDEISVVFSDLAGENTEWWFGGQVQKLVSISAALATAKFNSLREGGLALFDARVHHLDGLDGVLEYVQWRQTDAMKNSVGMLASHYFSHKKLMGMSTDDRVTALRLEKNVEWTQLLPALRRGSWVHRELRNKTTTFVQNGEEKTVEFQRKEWIVEDAPRFRSVESLGLTGI